MSPRWSFLPALLLGTVLACQKSDASATPRVAPQQTGSTAQAATEADPPAGHAQHAHDVPGAPAPPPSAATAPGNAPAHGPGGHAHGSPHGGVVMSAPGGGHIEAKLERTGRVSVWLLDDHEHTVAAQGARGTVRLAVAGAQDVPLSFDAALNALVGQVPAPSSEHVVGLVTVTYAGGRTATVRALFHLESAGH